MSRFNNPSPGTKTKNRAGGDAYAMTPELELATLLLTSLGKDQFYISEAGQYNRLEQLIEKNDPLFAAKAAIYARTKMGMRTISHVAAGLLGDKVSGNPWAKDFYDQVVYRVDDMTEIISFLKSKKLKLPSALKKGFASAFDRFDAYQLAKYRSEKKTVKLVDVVNTVHPVPTEKNAEAINALIYGTLKNTNTWEAKLTQAGKLADGEDDKQVKKKEAWKDLIESRTLGYMALVKNLRNIVEQSPEALDAALNMLTDQKLIHKSLMLPFRYLTAYKMIVRDVNDVQGRKILQAINKAINISFDNIPVFEGNTLVAVDASGSMTSYKANDHVTCAEMAMLFGIALAKKNNADIMRFHYNAWYENYDLDDSLFGILRGLRWSQQGTDMFSVFDTANKKYDRMIFITDNESWAHTYQSANSRKKAYCENTGCDPYIYTWAMASAGSNVFPQHKVAALAGFNDKIFDVMAKAETDPKALINEIKAIPLGS